MQESYLQYAGGKTIENVSLADIKKAITEIEKMDEEHGAFWVSVFKEEEYVMEVEKDLAVSIVLGEQDERYQGQNWSEVLELFSLLLDEKFDEVLARVKK